ncbi:MAG: DUF1800 domain-containing protein [Saprospiraceae bacterium]
MFNYRYKSTISPMHDMNHLYWRAGFGLSPETWQQRKDWSRKKAVDQLFKQAKKANPLPIPVVPDLRQMGKLTQEERDEIRKQDRAAVININSSWVLRMADPKEAALLERMTLFWHGHFACRSRSGKLAAQQLNTLRKHALGDFRSLLLGIAQDPSMIRYLNNQQNKKKSPNENFAREVMELFTMGRGHYTEQDIKEAARAFTGWSSTSTGDFIFRERVHDTGTKTFLGKTGHFGGEDIIDLLLEQRATADFITRKIYRYFVNPKIDEQEVSYLSQQFYDSNYDIEKLMHLIFSSESFYAARNKGSKIKSPVEFLAGMIKTLGLTLEDERSVLFLQRALGQVLFDPPNVAGWPGDKNWIDNATLMLRLNIAQSIVGATAFNFREKAGLEDRKRAMSRKKIEAKSNIQPLIQLAEGRSNSEDIEDLAAYLLLAETKIKPELIEQYSPVQNREAALTLYSLRLMSLPEYQMC